MSDQPPRPVFTVTQPTGSPVTLDFTTPGPFGDFAFTGRFADSTAHTFGTYHTAEHQLFIDVLRCWTAQRPGDEVAATLRTSRMQLAAMTTRLQPTTRSENRFERWDLDQIRTARQNLASRASHGTASTAAGTARSSSHQPHRRSSSPTNAADEMKRPAPSSRYTARTSGCSSLA